MLEAQLREGSRLSPRALPPALSSSWRPLNAAELFARANARYSLSFTKYSCLGPELNRLRNDGDTIVEDVRNARVQRGRASDNLYGSPFIGATLPAYVNDLDGHRALLRAALNHQFDGGGEF